MHASCYWGPRLTLCYIKQYLKKSFSINVNSIINLSLPFPAMISLLVWVVVKKEWPKYDWCSICHWQPYSVTIALLNSILWVTVGHPAPCYLNSNKLFLTLSNQYFCSEWDSNLGPKRLLNFDFETWRLRPLGQLFLLGSSIPQPQRHLSYPS